MATMIFPEEVAQIADKTATAFRLGHEAYANEYFTEFIDLFSKAINSEILEQRPEITLILSEIFEAQQKRDILKVADLLQYKLL